MIIYFADRAMNILGSASTGLPKGLMITNDKKTEEISEGVAIFECNLDYDFANSNKDEKQEVDVKKLAAVGNFILKQSADDGKAEVYTIIDSTIDPIQKDASIYAEDAGLDLLNEVVGTYTADKAYSIDHYINKFAYDSGFEIGINEVSNLTRKLSWDGEATATERLLSVATQFDNAEIEFCFKVENMAVTGKYINVYKKRGNDSGITLTIGKEVSGFRIKSSIADLATAYRCTGGTPEGSENPITLDGYKYDDGDFHVSGNYVMSRKALEKWSRYQIKTEKKENNVGHIVKTFSYDTTSKSELCNRAVSSLKKVCDEAVTYEVELLYLPDGVKVGDTVSIVDDDDNTYLTARLLKLETSESNDTKEAELGDYVRQESGIDEKVIELAERFEKIAKNRNFYTWTAFADDENGTGISANAYGKDYLGIATNRLVKEADLSDPTQYTWVKIKGEQGIPGTAGKDGKTTYFHMKYSAVPNPTSYSDMTETPNKYIGTYADYELDDSTDPSKYTWGKFQGDNGEDGADGIPGKNGENGETSYVHFAYATSADGKTGFSTTDTAGKTYMGQYVDFNKEDSEDPTKYRWSKFQGPTGEKGATGDTGPAGKDGTNGKTSYFHIRYSPVENPTASQITETPDAFIGTYVDYTGQDSTDPSKYTWYRFKGLQGERGTQGIPGTNGADGKTTYLHIKYSNDGGKTFTSNSGETSGDYIGQCTDFNKEDPTNVNAYTWSRIKGETGSKGEKGETGAIGPQGPQGETGTAGRDAIIVSKTVPENPEINQLWQTESGQPIMRWNGTEWVLHYLSVENLNVDALSAITADLGTVTAGVIKNKAGTVNINVEKGTIDTYDDEYNASSTYAAGTSVYHGKDPATNPATLSIDYYQILYKNGSMGTATALTPMNGDWWVGKDPWNGDNDEVLPIYASLSHLLKKETGMVAGSKVVQIANGNDSVELFSSDEVNTLLGGTGGASTQATVVISNGDGTAYGIHTEGCVYQNGIWYACFAAKNTSGRNLPVRINFIIMAI